MSNPNMQPSQILKQCQNWLEKMVIDLDLCPFAAAPIRSELMRIKLSHAQQESELIDELVNELCYLAEIDSSIIETSLIIIPNNVDGFVHTALALHHGGMHIAQVDNFVRWVFFRDRQSFPF